MTENVYKFHSPSAVTIAGPSQGGKTFLALQILRNAGTMFTEPPKSILYCYGVYQSKFDNLEREIPNFKLHEGLPSRETIMDNKNGGSSDGNNNKFPHSLVVLDDLQSSMTKSDDIVNLFTRDIHHSNTSCITLMQNALHQSKYSRTISLNTNYLILMKTFRDLQQVHFLSRQMFPGKSQRLVEAFTDATERPRGYLVINNLTINPDEDLRLATNILPHEDLVLYTSK